MIRFQKATKSFAGARHRIALGFVGFEEFGKCCQAGPTRDGRCGRIINVTGSPNGTTQDDSQSLSNLPPCVPKRSHWYRMRSMRLNVAIFTGGLLLLCLTIPQREKLFVPGPLSDKHSQILENTLVSQRCSLCHTETEQFLKGFQPSNVLSTLVANDGRQDELCLKCHKEADAYGCGTQSTRFVSRSLG